MGEKRGRKNNDFKRGEEKKQTKRQRLAAASNAPYFTPKPSSSTKYIDVPLEELMPQQRIDMIADLSESILEDPVSALTSSRTAISTSNDGKSSSKTKDPPGPNKVGYTPQQQTHYHKTQSKMHILLDLASMTKNGHDAHAARLGLLSLLAIFQDILPAYRIRLPTEAEMNVRVSKETKKTWDHERKLLQSYQHFLQLLEKTWEGGKSGHKGLLSGENNAPKAPPTNLAATAILCLSQLLQTCYNFNFRSNLLQIIIRQANHRTSEEVRSSCCKALSTMFAKDVQGEASLEAVRRMAKMVKEKNVVHPDFLNTWLSLPLRVHEDEAIAAKLAAQAKSKKAKKSQQGKEMMEIEKELKEGEAVADKIEIAKNQADMLHQVTLTYFRVLKTVSRCFDGEGEGDKDDSAASELLPAALRGLAKFSHLIHMDAVVDLLAVLKDLLKNVNSLPTDASIHCILCALKTLQGPGRTIPVDPKEYLIPLYNVIAQLGVDKIESEGNPINSNERAETVKSAIQCIEHAFLQRRELSTTRLAAFLKRLTSASLHCPPQLATPILACSRQIASRYSSSSSSKIGQMLENEEEVIAEGTYSPDAEDPEHANAHSTSLWELSLLRFHINPKVAEHAAGMAEGRMLKLPAEAPLKILDSMERDAQDCYISHKFVLKKHPLDASPSGGDDNEEGTAAKRKKRREQRRKQNQVRFITPRKTSNWHLLPPTSYSLLW